ncbi:unnamed protein product [Coffea canephora]|uniref:Protein KAKU4 n=1 Tax=Coffea canephora TaxID=49390 RepID=A0A068VBA5_COFCA|nr:unnamed protein product [Coffea canephora]
MATGPGSGRATEARSGGKIVTNRRRKLTTATPYDRPPQPPPQESPNWLTGVIFPATRKIASGAAKILSTVFDSSSSSSSSSSDSEAASDDDANQSNKDREILSEALECVDKEPQLSLYSSVTKIAIERLLTQESFSREERDRLVQIIDSRVMMGGEENILPTGVPVGTVGNDTADLCTKAVAEARKWLEEKRVESSPLSDLAHESHGLSHIKLQRSENEAGSPIDVAKSYMKSRPPWASPLAEHIELRTASAIPSEMTRELFREKTPASCGGGSLSSSKKRNFASCSWNIEEEIRRVRSKASEDMLNSLSSSKIDLSPLATTLKPRQDSLIADIPNSRGDLGNKSNIVTGTPSSDASVHLAAGLNTSIGISALETRQDDLANESLTPHPAAIVSEEYQDLEAFKITDECPGSKSNHVTLDLATEHLDEPRSSQTKVSPAGGVREFDEIGNDNGLHTSQERGLSLEVGTREVDGQAPDGNAKADGNDLGTTSSIPLEDARELISEASIEVPIVDETNGFGNVSQTSPVVHNELSQEPTQPYIDKVAQKADGKAVKHEAKKPGKYNRRGRGRGK